MISESIVMFLISMGFQFHYAGSHGVGTAIAIPVRHARGYQADDKKYIDDLCSHAVHFWEMRFTHFEAKFPSV